MKIKIQFLLIAIFLTACSTSEVNANMAEQTLASFFDYLAKGEYGAASTLYGGSYETLVTFNPELDPKNFSALLQRGCQVNGLQCLPVRTMTFNQVTAGGVYIFTVEFLKPDNSLFILDACCRDNPTSPPKFQFEYRVVEVGDGQFLVLDLPVYVP